MAIIHAFEKAGLGQAPFKLVGNEFKQFQACTGAPMQVGGSCDYCGTGISDMYIIRSADGREFKVGSTCVEKTGDKGLIDTVKREMNRIKTERRHARERARIDEGKAWMAEVRDRLESMPHPRGFSDRRTGDPLTLADYVDWMMFHSGNAGQLRTIKTVRKVLGAG